MYPAIVIEQFADGSFEVGALNNEIDHPVFEQKFRGLETLRELLLGDLLYHSGTREANQRGRLGNDDVRDCGVTRGDAAIARIGQQ